jgi:hypothetical protein
VFEIRESAGNPVERRAEQKSRRARPHFA